MQQLGTPGLRQGDLPFHSIGRMSGRLGKRCDLRRESLAQVACRDLQVVLRLQVHPHLRIDAEEPAKPQPKGSARVTLGSRAAPAALG